MIVLLQNKASLDHLRKIGINLLLTSIDASLNLSPERGETFVGCMFLINKILKAPTILGEELGRGRTV